MYPSEVTSAPNWDRGLSQNFLDRIWINMVASTLRDYNVFWNNSIFDGKVVLRN